MGHAGDEIAAADRTMVGGVELTLYATAEDANAGENALGTMKTGVMGIGGHAEPGPRGGDLPILS